MQLEKNYNIFFHVETGAVLRVKDPVRIILFVSFFVLFYLIIYYYFNVPKKYSERQSESPLIGLTDWSLAPQNWPYLPSLPRVSNLRNHKKNNTKKNVQ